MKEVDISLGYICVTRHPLSISVYSNHYHMTIHIMSTFLAPKPVGRRARKPGIDRKPRQAYSAKQLDRLESEFKVKKAQIPNQT